MRVARGTLCLYACVRAEIDRDAAGTCGVVSGRRGPEAGGEAPTDGEGWHLIGALNQSCRGATWSGDWV